MTATLPVAAAGTEPAASPGPPQRPRLLSYTGRWGRARRWIPGRAAVVLDVGAAFGYGTAAVAARSPHLVVAVERDPTHVDDARRNFPWLPLLRASAEQLPVPDGSVDALLLLDVIEHVADPAAVLAEAHRALRAGGALVVSVPHAGLLEPLDSLNVYPRLARLAARTGHAWPPLAAADDCDSGAHQHFTLAQLTDRLGPGFAIDRVALTGVGLAELVHLFTLVVVRALLGWERAYRALLLVHLLVYLLDDLVPLGRAGYYLTVAARRLPDAEPA